MDGHEDVEAGDVPVCLKALADSTISRQHFYLQESLTGQWSINDNDSPSSLGCGAPRLRTHGVRAGEKPPPRQRREGRGRGFAEGGLLVQFLEITLDLIL